MHRWTLSSPSLFPLISTSVTHVISFMTYKLRNYYTSSRVQNNRIYKRRLKQFNKVMGQSSIEHVLTSIFSTRFKTAIQLYPTQRSCEVCNFVFTVRQSVSQSIRSGFFCFVFLFVFLFLFQFLFFVLFVLLVFFIMCFFSVCVFFSMRIIDKYH